MHIHIHNSCVFLHVQIKSILGIVAHACDPSTLAVREAEAGKSQIQVPPGQLNETLYQKGWGLSLVKYPWVQLPVPPTPKKIKIKIHLSGRYSSKLVCTPCKVTSRHLMPDLHPSNQQIHKHNRIS